MEVGDDIDLKFTLSMDHLDFGEPEEITDEALNWSDI